MRRQPAAAPEKGMALASQTILMQAKTCLQTLMGAAMATLLLGQLCTAADAVSPAASTISLT